MVLEIGLGSVELGIDSSMAHWKWNRGDYFPGASLQVWRDFFPNAFIVGIDISQESVRQANERFWGDERVLAVQSSSFDVDRIEQLFGPAGRVRSIGKLSREDKILKYFKSNLPQKFDVIFDDGLHTLPAQLASLCVLYPYLSPKRGTYVIEDVTGVKLFLKVLKHFFLQQPLNSMGFVTDSIEPLGAVVMMKESESPHRYPRLRYAPLYYELVLSVGTEVISRSRSTPAGATFLKRLLRDSLASTETLESGSFDERGEFVDASDVVVNNTRIISRPEDRTLFYNNWWIPIKEAWWEHFGEDILRGGSRFERTMMAARTTRKPDFHPAVDRFALLEEMRLYPSGVAEIDLTALSYPLIVDLEEILLPLLVNTPNTTAYYRYIAASNLLH